jgi:D-3-phosphoglycerate dehydrogenase
MPRVLLAGRIHEDGMAILRARPDLVIEDMEDQGEQAFIDRLPEADALLIRTAVVPAEAVRRSSRLRPPRACRWPWSATSSPRRSPSRRCS